MRLGKIIFKTTSYTTILFNNRNAEVSSFYGQGSLEIKLLRGALVSQQGDPFVSTNCLFSVGAQTMHAANHVAQRILENDVKANAGS